MTNDATLSYDELEQLARRETALLEYATEFVVFVDRHGEIEAAVGPGLSALGHDRNAPLGTHIAEHLHPEDLPVVLEVMERARARGDFRGGVRARARHRDGHWLWLQASVTAVPDHEVLGTGAVLRVRQVDEPERLEGGAEDADRFLSLAEALPSGILSADARGWVVYANSAAQQILDLPADRIQGRGWLDAVHADDLPDVVDAAGLVVRAGSRQQATFRIQTGLFVRWATVRFVPLHDEGRRTGWIATVDDVTDRRRAESQLAHRATHDPLTDLPNRALLEDRLEQACARLRRDEGWVTVLFVDLDGFKEINDDVGHDAGDEVLREVARRLRSVLRPADTVARLGGDEFVAVCEGLESVDTENVRARITNSLAAPMPAGGVSLEVRASTGVVSTSDRRANPAELLTRADQDMYRQKRESRASG